MSLFSEFKEFISRGNVVDLAVGVIIGAAFGKIVSTLVDKVMMPPLGYLMGGIDFADKRLVLADAVPAKLGEAGEVLVKARPEVVIYWGEFVNASINFIIVAFALFCVVKAMNEARKRMEKKIEAAPPPAPAMPADVAILTEIRDLLRERPL